MNKLKKFFLNKGSSIAYALISAVFTLVPEDLLNMIPLCNNMDRPMKIFVIHIIICVFFILLANVIYFCYKKKRQKVLINGNNYCVQVEYGDLMKISDGKVVINFDECYTTNVGDNPGDIKTDSVCGQYLREFPISSMEDLIENADVKPERGKSLYKGKDKYAPGTIVPNGKYLLMAFAKLDQNGLGHLTYEDYIECLNKLWEQIDKWHATSDVYVPILGSRITRFDKDLTQQELLDVMIYTYLLSPKKMKKPFKLHIVCQEREGFSINDVFGVV